MAGAVGEWLWQEGSLAEMIWEPLVKWGKPRALMEKGVPMGPGTEAR